MKNVVINLDFIIVHQYYNPIHLQLQIKGNYNQFQLQIKTNHNQYQNNNHQNYCYNNNFNQIKPNKVKIKIIINKLL